MSSNRTNRRSIAAQLVILFTIAAALLLTCALGICYWLVIRHALAEDNAALAEKISALRQDVKQFGPAKVLAMQLTAGRAGERSTYWVRVLDPIGRPITETPGMTSLLPPYVFPPPHMNAAGIHNPKNYRVRHRIFSLVSTLEQSDGNGYVIQVAQDRSVDEDFQREFGLLFFAILALSILASVGIARTVTRRGLQPLAEMTRSLQRIGPTRLNERVAPLSWPRELQPLAEAFDQMLSRLEDSFTRLSQFSADLAHELRTPVANILGEAQVALTRDRTSNEYREVIESTVAECERLSRIVENLLFVARAESAREHIKRIQFDGRAAIEKIAGYYGTAAEERHVVIECEGDAKINGDPVLFSRAVSNLMENALRFTPDDGKIRVSVAAGVNETRVSVSDTGAGIAPEHLPRVFDRFYRADSSRSCAGAGLGLALVKSIADLHGGSAQIESHIGHGTTVSLTFPDSQ